ncbi:MAG: 2-phospho-L-lactate guanylyltransferase [Actinomycetia bacterium]|nr:2-phospho-L-lactate guanylyltransferase [Actinomycetes bacterium]
MSEIAPRTALLVPSRSLRGAKTRLDSMLNPNQRAQLAEAMLAKTIGAAGALEPFVVTGDPDVTITAKEQGAQVIECLVPGLNIAVATGIDHLHRAGFDRVVVAHGDIPLVHDLDAVDRPQCRGVIIVPDRHVDGTNIIAVPTGFDFRWSYGPGSFHRHRIEALRLGLPLVVRKDADLAWDLDEPADIELAADSLPPDLAYIIGMDPAFGASV